MAKVNGGKESMISGLIGPVVFVNFNGKHYVRKAPRERSKNSWSEEQEKARNRFKEVNAFWKRFYYTPVKPIWDLAAEGMRGVNLFVKINTSAFGADGTIKDLDRLHFSAGKLPLPHKLKALRSAEDPQKIEVIWENDSENGPAASNDELIMMIAHEGNFTGPFKTGVQRKTAAAVISLPPGCENAEGIYLFFGNEKRKLYSVDQWFGI